MKNFFAAVFGFVMLGCASQEPKMNGVSFVASPNEIDIQAVQPVVDVSANWATVMPFGYLRSLSTPEVVFNIEWQWWGERRDGAKKTIELLKEKGIKVMLKPQIWIRHGEFTGHIKMESEEDWKQLEKTYTSFIMTYAELAEESKTEILCIGTELHTFAQHRPEYWKELIKSIRNVYKGELTYAENWDQFDKVPFLDQLDYIGVDAYFPVSKSKTPTVQELREGWQPHKMKIMKLYEKYKKPVVFAEYGYRSTYYTGKEPWNTSVYRGDVDMQAQMNALTALYEEFWSEPWFAGGFIWKWFHNHDQVGGANNNMFTIQNKPSEQLIKEFYSKHN